MIQRFRQNNIDNPGLNGTVTLYDEVNDVGPESVNKIGVRITLRTNQPITINVYWSDAHDGTLFLVKTRLVAAMTTGVLDLIEPLRPGHNKIEAVATTAPTVWACARDTIDGYVGQAP
jgi:hypothetical protein